jgi:hypothetical protein
MQAQSDIFLGWTRSPGPDKVDRIIHRRVSYTRPSRGRAAPASLVEIGHLLITADHEKPGTKNNPPSPSCQTSPLRV